MSDKKEESTKSMDAKAMIDKNAKAGTKIRYNERVECVVIKDARHLKEGKTIFPHPVMAEQLIKDGIVKKVTKN